VGGGGRGMVRVHQHTHSPRTVLKYLTGILYSILNTGSFKEA
jgi:hypothetical protein